MQASHISVDNTLNKPERKMNESKGNLTVSYFHVTYKFQSESTLYSSAECQETPCSNQEPYLKFK